MSNCKRVNLRWMRRWRRRCMKFCWRRWIGRDSRSMRWRILPGESRTMAKFRDARASTMSIIGAAGRFTGWGQARRVTCAERGRGIGRIRFCGVEQLERGQRAIESSERLEPLARAGELAAFGLRMNAGWPLGQFRDRTGFDLKAVWQPEIERLIGLGYGNLKEDRFQLTEQGMRYADWAAEEFLRG